MSERLTYYRRALIFSLCARPSIWEGIARLIDIGATLNEYNYSETAMEADYRALRSDWEMVAQDMWSAIGRFDQEHYGKPATHRI